MQPEPLAAVAPHPRLRRSGLLAVLASCFGVGLTFGMATPLVSLVMESWGHGSLTIGLMAATYSLAILLAGPFVPALMNRMGPVTVMLSGMTIAVAGLVAFPMAGMLGLLFGLRLMMGVGSGLNWVASEAWISSVAAEHNRGRVVAIYVTLWGGGLALGPLTLLVVGTTGTLPFLVAAAVLCVAFVPILSARGAAPSLHGPARPRALLAGLGSAPVAMAASFLAGYGETTFVSLFPIYGLVSGHGETAVVVMTSVFALGALALQPLLGWLADHSDRNRLLSVVTLLCLACMAAVPFAIHSPLLWPVLVLWGGGSAGLYTLGLVLLGQKVKGTDLPAANAGFIMCYTLGMVIGPVAGGAGMRLSEPHGLLPALAVPTALLLVLMLRRPRG